MSTPEAQAPSNDRAASVDGPPNGTTINTNVGNEGSADPDNQTPTSAAPSSSIQPHSASLYVGELDPSVTEAMLFELFSSIGQVASIRVCRDAVSRRSLGYAYVNYNNTNDGERALEELNYTLIKGRPCRIMWSQRDPGLRKTGQGNVFIKNLDTAIDNKALHDTFAAFGNILSCKVAQDEAGNSKGYGFVHYETAEAATQAIKQVNGMLLNDKKVFVGHHIAKKDRQSKFEEMKANFTNIYVKNIDYEVGDDEFRELFEKYGDVSSASIARNDEGKSRGFGFVNYIHHEDATRAVEELHDKDFHGQNLYVGRAQKKHEREEELRKQYEQARQEKASKYTGVNLYVKNLTDDVDDDKLRDLFSTFGTITSTKVMRDSNDRPATPDSDKNKENKKEEAKKDEAPEDGGKEGEDEDKQDAKKTDAPKGIPRSRGFGFVCFSNPDEASKAVSDMNGKMISGKPLYVALAQRKDVRKSQLEASIQQRNTLRQQQAVAGMSAGYIPPTVFYGPGQQPVQFSQRGGVPFAGQPGMVMPGMQGVRPGQIPAGFPQQGRGMAQGQQFPPQFGMPGGVPFPMQSGPGGLANGAQFNPAMMAQMQAAAGIGGRGGGGRGQVPGMGGMPPNMANMSGIGGRSYPQGGPRGQVPIQQGQVNRMQSGRGQMMGMGQPGSNPFDASAANPSLQGLSQVTPQQQKQLLGEAIYPKISAQQPELAGKITGMLLEMDNAELLSL